MKSSKTMVDIIEKIRNKPIIKDIYPELDLEEIIYETKVEKPVSFDIKRLNGVLGIEIPEELQKFWALTSRICVFCDKTYGQRGLYTFSPNEIIEIQDKTLIQIKHSKIFGDLVIGGFHGDGELIVMRCDPSDTDYNAIIITAETAGREEWELVAANLREFLHKCINLSPLTLKYWW